MCLEILLPVLEIIHSILGLAAVLLTKVSPFPPPPTPSADPSHTLDYIIPLPSTLFSSQSYTAALTFVVHSPPRIAEKMSLYKPTFGISKYHETVLWSVQNSKYICILLWVLNIMYLMPEDGQYHRNIQHVLTGLIIFVLVDGNTNVSFYYYIPQWDEFYT